MTETSAIEGQIFDLDESKMDWVSVEPNEEGPGRWSFRVSDCLSGRMIALYFTKALGIPADKEKQIKKGLSSPIPIQDLRLDQGGQMSFMEYDEDDDNKGPITLVEIFMRYGAGVEDPEYYDRYISAIQSILDKVKLAKEKAQE